MHQQNTEHEREAKKTLAPPPPTNSLMPALIYLNAKGITGRQDSSSGYEYHGNKDKEPAPPASNQHRDLSVGSMH